MNPCLLLPLLLTLTSSVPAGQGKPAASPAPDHAQAARELVSEFFRTWKDGQATKSSAFLLSSDTVIVGVSPSRPSRQAQTWRKEARAWLEEQERSPPRHLVLDEVRADTSAGALSVVTARYTGWGIKGTAVFTLAWSEGRWKVATTVLESHFNW